MNALTAECIEDSPEELFQKERRQEGAVMIGDWVSLRVSLQVWLRQVSSRSSPTKPSLIPSCLVSPMVIIGVGVRAFGSV